MRNCRLTSRKCSDPKSIAFAALVALASQLAVSRAAEAAPTPAKPTLDSLLQRDLDAHARTQSPQFEALLARWEKSHGKRLVPSLEKLSRNTLAKDRSRYIAMMALVRLEKEKAVTKLLPLAKDSSWMVRSGTLKAASLTRSAQGVALAEMLLKDKALVIRTQAIETLIELNPPHLKDLLVKAVFDPINYRGGSYSKGRGEWVPQRALSGLRKIRAKDSAAKLVPLLTHSPDAKLRAHALFTIESLEGKQLKPNAPFKERARAWARYYAKSR